MIEKWYAKPPEAIAEQFGCDLSVGLSPKAARARLREEGENAVFALPHTPARTYAAYVVADVSMLLLVLTAILAAVWGQGSASMLIFALLALHLGAAIVTYIKARRIVESMAVCAMPRVRVLRGGRLYAIDARQLVRGDILLLRPGDVIPCDARLCTATGLEVLEYAGRVDGKQRRGRAVKDAARLFHDRGALAVGEQTNMVFAGSVVLAGEGRAIVVETGFDTVLVSTEGQIPLISTRDRDRLPALEALKRHCGRSSLVMLVLILPLTLLGLRIGGELNLLDYFLLALALAVSSMSELTAAIGYIIVGSGLLRTARGDGVTENTAILPYLADLPKLARADTLVLLDDTALTEGKLAVTAAFAGTTRIPLGDIEGLRELFETALIASALPTAGGVSADGRAPDPAQNALLTAAASHGADSETLRRRMRLIDFAPVSAANPFATALIEEQRAPYAVCCGDAAALLPRCTRTVDRAAVGGNSMLRRDRIDVLLAACAKETAAGGYAVAYARRSSPYNTLQRLSVLQDEMILMGVLIFRDPLGAGVPEAVEALSAAGVRTVLMADRPSGGGSIEVLARAAGILCNGVICRAPAPISDDAELCIGYTQTARREWLEKQQTAGRMTVGLGARASDLTVLQRCGVSAACSPVEYGRGREDSPLASLDPTTGEDYGCALLKKNAGLLVRRPSGFGGALSGIDAACRAARRIETNLASALRCLSATQAMRLAAVVLLLALRQPILTPLQLLFGGLILDFGAILVCAFDRGQDSAPTEGFFDRPFRACIPQTVLGLICGITVALTTFFLCGTAVLSGSAASGFAFVSLTLGQIALLFACRRGNARLLGSRFGLLWPFCAAVFLALAFAWPTFGAPFAVTMLPAAAFCCLSITPLVAIFGGEIVHTFDDREAGLFDGLDGEEDDDGTA